MRRQYITHPQFQKSFTISYVLGALFILVLIGVTNFSAVWFLAQNPMLSPVQEMALFSSAKGIFFLQVTLGLVLAVLFSLIGVYFSYKLVGPLRRLELYLEGVLHGQNPREIKLRPGDELGKISKVINQIVNERREKIKKKS